MIPVMQTNIGGRGNCMAACWASILEISIDEVPDYRAIEAGGGSWMNAINTWLSKHHGMLYWELEPWVCAVVMPVGWHLINGNSIDGVGGHACVAYCGRVVHDPVAGGRGCLKVDNYGVLVPLTPELKATWEATWKECLCGRCIRGDA